MNTQVPPTTESGNSLPSQDERVMAGLSHVAALMPMMGVIVPIVIWVTQKEKSRYVAFQSLQAAAYQFIMIAAWFLGMGCYVFSFLGMIVFLPFSSSSNYAPADSSFPFAFLIPFTVIGAIFVGGFLFIVYGLAGAVMTLQGKPFRYVFVGNRVERFMQK